MLTWLRYTSEKPFVYWFVGSLLIWLLVPFSLVDIMMDPEWAAPNPQCDSLGIPIFQTRAAALPWAFISIIFSAVLTISATWKRKAGSCVFQFRLGTLWINILISIILVPVVLVALYDFGLYVWHATVPTLISSDCGGRSELVEITRRRPAFQTIPFLQLGISVWLLHLRAAALSPKKLPRDGEVSVF